MNQINYKSKVIDNLQSGIADARQLLLSLLQDWYYMQNILQPRLNFLYDSLFGELEDELVSKSELAKQLERRVELLSKHIGPGKKVDGNKVDYINNLIEKESKFKRNSNQETFENNTDFGKKKNTEFAIPEEVEIPHLYRRLVKKLHPDKAGESEEFKKFWYNIQDAYRTKNLSRLRMFHKTLCSEEKDYDDSFSHELRLRNEIRQLKMNIAAEKRRLQRLRSQEPFVYENKLTDRIWVAQRRNHLQRRIFRLDRKIRTHRSKLIDLAEGNWPLIRKLIHPAGKSSNGKFREAS